MAKKRKRPDYDWGVGDSAIVPSFSGSPVPAARLAESVKEYARHRFAENTVKAYATDWKIFKEWCSWNGREALPALSKTICAFLIDAADGITLGKPKKASTVSRYLASISTMHKRAKYPSPWDDPEIKDVFIAIRNKKSKDSRTHLKKKAALMAVTLEDVLSKIPLEGKERLVGLRNTALLGVGFATGERRSEVVAMDVEHLRFVPGEGVIVTIPRSKTDQTGEGRYVGIQEEKGPVCPVRALKLWLSEAKIETGPVFRQVWSSTVGDRISDDTYVRVIKEAVARVGLDPALYAGHSLRSGFVTSADENGASLGQIMLQTGHKDPKTVIGYMQTRDLLGPKSAGFGILNKKRDGVR